MGLYRNDSQRAANIGGVTVPPGGEVNLRQDQEQAAAALGLVSADKPKADPKSDPVVKVVAVEPAPKRRGRGRSK